MMCHKMGINIWEVIDAAKTKPFGFMPFYPGLGVGGHCIPDDPLYLYWKAKHHGFSSKFIKLAADINSGMPEYAVGRLSDILRENHRELKGSRILVLGVTYKKDVRDLRKSPPLRMISLLKDKGVVVDFYDPIIPFLKIEGIDQPSVTLDAKTLKSYDCVVIATDHTDVNYQLVRREAKRVYDIRNVYAGVQDKKIVLF
jgi:UDP-N-acetyl-D-glucosamine dehydrogenase